MFNAEIARKACAWLRQHPENHYQGTWLQGPLSIIPDNILAEPCGTRMCFGGTVALLAAPAGSVVRNAAITVPGDRPRSVGSFAAEALGIPKFGYAADMFFYHCETVAELEAVTAHLAAHPEDGQAAWEGGIELPAEENTAAYKRLHDLTGCKSGCTYN
jgi:hypothetical protein